MHLKLRLFWAILKIQWSIKVDILLFQVIRGQYEISGGNAADWGQVVSHSYYYYAFNCFASAVSYSVLYLVTSSAAQGQVHGACISLLNKTDYDSNPP